MTFLPASSTAMPSSMLLMIVSRRSRWLRTSPSRPVTESAIVLNSRASHEIVSDPAAGTRRARSPPAIRRAVVSKRCSRRSTTTRTTSAMAATSSSVRAPLPATIQRRSRFIDARISPASMSRIRMPLIRWPGSWHAWHASRFRTGTTVRSTVPPRVSMTRGDPR